MDAMPGEMLAGSGNLHLDFVCRISANHVQHGKAASGVAIEPRVESQDEFLEDDKNLTVGNLALYLAPRDGAVAIHDGRLA